MTRQAWAKPGRGNRHAQGYGSAWERVRKVVLERDSYCCQPCKRRGRVTAARAVDHIRPKAKGGTDAPDNLQAICDPCHTAKTIRDNGGTPKRRFGSDGWPIEEGE